MSSGRQRHRPVDGETDNGKRVALTRRPLDPGAEGA